jgi:hypothetical protein
MKYDKKEYEKYRKEIEKNGEVGDKPISFKMWKVMQPIADKVMGKANKIINKKIK